MSLHLRKNIKCFQTVFSYAIFDVSMVEIEIKSTVHYKFDNIYNYRYIRSNKFECNSATRHLLVQDVRNPQY